MFNYSYDLSPRITALMFSAEPVSLRVDLTSSFCFWEQAYVYRLCGRKQEHVDTESANETLMICMKIASMNFILLVVKSQYFCLFETETEHIRTIS